MEGYIFDIKRFAIHDGPGIRTTVFFKGCPLRCVWCHNPEGLEKGKDIWVKAERCIGCASCVEVCSYGALYLSDNVMSIQKDRCTFCNKCTIVCPTLAIQRIDCAVSVCSLVEDLLKDKLFADVSKGGVTLSGGEPLAQPEFVCELLTRLKEHGVHTCIETSLAAPLDIVMSVASRVDLMMVDLKLMDSIEHKRYIGIPNTDIMNNFRALSEKFTNIEVRVPLVPGITATKKNLVTIRDFVNDCTPDIPIELLNYNPLAPNKYRLLGLEYFDSDLRGFTSEEMDEWNKLIG